MPKKNGAALVSELEAAFGQPDPEDWQTQYPPEDVPGYAAELADLEDQLDLRWPKWRDREPFAHLRVDAIEGIKIRLLRRELILLGKGDHGVAIARRPKDGYPMALPVRPNRRRGVAQDAYRPIVTIPLLVDRLGMPAAQVKELLSRLPPTVRDVRSWLVGERERLAAASLPVSDPLPDLPSGGAA
jgi:hypothetical protein